MTLVLKVQTGLVYNEALEGHVWGNYGHIAFTLTSTEIAAWYHVGKTICLTSVLCSIPQTHILSLQHIRMYFMWSEFIIHFYFDYL